jgi:hypothetical protein
MVAGQNLPVIQYIHRTVRLNDQKNESIRKTRERFALLPYGHKTSLAVAKLCQQVCAARGTPGQSGACVEDA